VHTYGFVLEHAIFSDSAERITVTAESELIAYDYEAGGKVPLEDSFVNLLASWQTN